jgi:hypothetical protein
MKLAIACLFSILISVNSYLALHNKVNIFSHFASNKDSERDEQMRIQKEILERRKNPSAKKALFEKVNDRRVQAAEQIKKTMWAQNTDSKVDPLDGWKEAKAKGLVKDLGYEEITPEKKKSILGFSVPIIQSPIDLPGYDNGQRFDLRLPYAERGYEDPDADFMGKLMGLFKRGKSASKDSKPIPGQDQQRKKMK